MLDLESEVMRGLGSNPTGGNIFHWTFLFSRSKVYCQLCLIKKKLDYPVECPGSTPVYWRLQNSIISSENDQTKILHDEWVSPSHRVNKRSLVKSAGGLWFIPSFLKPDPNWMRESHTYTDQRLVDIRLSAENLGSKEKNFIIEFWR